jgi:mannose-6-phosphate isomerase-like protein (cupin superfamily)
MRISLATAAGLSVVACLAMSAQEAVKVITPGDVDAEVGRLTAQSRSAGSSGSKLAASGNFALNLSLRSSSGGAEVHAHYDDLMIVKEGSATLITGGTVIGAKTDSAGETKGSGIQGGSSQTIKAGDMVLVPAGVPHQLLIPPGTLYTALVVKTRE